MFDPWLPHISCWNVGVQGRLFKIIRLSGGGLQRSAATFLKHQRCVEMIKKGVREIFGAESGSGVGRMSFDRK